MTRSCQSEVVDDSEPEREELRIQERCERARGQSQNLRAPLNVVELSDDESTDDQGCTTASPSKVNAELTNIELRPPAAQDTLDVIDTQSSIEEDEPKISLARFAYSGAITRKTSIVSTSLTRGASSASSIAETRPPPKRLAHRFVAHFSDSDLGKVTTCVSCDIRWTARKTATQKMLHIQSCAKKKGLADETVRILLRKEIESCVAGTALDKGKGKEKVVDPQTLLEEVLAETAPKRKGRRKEVGETVKTISQTRGLILERARAIIAPTSSSKHNDDQDYSSVYTQFLGTSLSHSNLNVPPPATQAFGNSALAQARQTMRKLFDYDAENEDFHNGTPSNSPTLAPSRLGPHVNAERSFISPINYLSVSSSTSADVIDDGSKERIMNARTKAFLERSSGSSLSNQFLSLPERDNKQIVILRNRNNSTIDPAPDNDDLRCDPEFENLSYDMYSLRTKPESTLLKIPPSKIWSRSPTKSNVTTRSIRTPSIKTKYKYTTFKRTGRMKSLLDNETVENLELKLKDKILEDTDLHLRILRYEPIHFDVFLKLMLDDPFPLVSEKARLRMRSLLDKQAIHFYGSEKTKRR
ncbi:hypothetical protein E4T56_gene16238 [Termitomyces sp. T112]|nr:hypothetical protein E4T56_gene16238 [Termitomyces sp. T112]